MEEVGKVLEASTPLGFLVKAEIDSTVALHDYVVVELNELVGKEVKPLQVLAEVTSLEAKNPLATETMALEQKSSIYSYKILRTEVLGYLDDGRIFRPKSAPNPGTSVYKADSSILQPYFKGEERRLPVYIGRLIREPEVEVPIHLQEGQFHMGIFAATRAGKSYLAGKIIEETLEKTIFPVIVVDIHGDYVKMNMLENEGVQHELFNVAVYQPPGAPKIEGLTAEQRELKIGFKQVSTDAMLMMLGKIGEIQSNIMEEILEELSKRDEPYGVKDVISKIKERLEERDDKDKPVLKGSERGSHLGLLRRLTGLSRFVPFTEEEVDIGSLFQPKTLSIICLSGLRASIQDSLTASIIDLVFNHQISMKDKHPESFIPTFLFIEEAHRVASGGSRFAVETISTAIREGSKYGFFLNIISQRPRSIDPDVLSNIGNYAVLRITNAQDQHIIESASESFSHRLVEDLPALNQGEAVLVGPFVPLPAHVKVFRRKTSHRGVTPNLYDIMQHIEKKMTEWDKSWK